MEKERKRNEGKNEGGRLREERVRQTRIRGVYEERSEKGEERGEERERERITWERGKGEIRGEINTRSLGNEPPAISVRVDRVPPPTPEATHHQPPSEPTDLPLNIPRCSLLIPLASLIPPCFSSYPLSLSLSSSPLSLSLPPPASLRFSTRLPPPPPPPPLVPSYLLRTYAAFEISPAPGCEPLDTASNIYDNRLHRNLDFAADTILPLEPEERRKENGVVSEIGVHRWMDKLG